MAPQEPFRRWPEKRLYVARRRSRVREAVVVVIALIAVIAFALGRRLSPDSFRQPPAGAEQPR